MSPFLFFASYVAHAVTTKTNPALPTVEIMLRILLSLLYPVAGISFALDAISRWSWKATRTFPFFTTESDTLETANRAGALLMVTRNSSWKPAASDDVLRDLTIEYNGKDDH